MALAQFRPATDPAEALQGNILHQIDASKGIFEIIKRLAEVASEVENNERRRAIGMIMDDLLKIADKLSEDASEAGENIARVLRRY